MKLAILFLVTLFSLCCSIHSLQFDLKQGEELCISESLTSGELIIGEYSILPVGTRVQVYVQDPSGTQVHTRLSGGSGYTSSEGSPDNKFAVTASMSGDYKTCFINNVYDSQALQSKTIVFTLRSGVGTKDYTEVAKKDSLKPIEIELKRLEDTVNSIHNQMKHLSEREIIMRATNDSTSSRVIWFSVISMVILISMKVAETLYLKRYFQAKKIIQ